MEDKAIDSDDLMSGREWLDQDSELMIFENDREVSDSKDLLNLTWKSDDNNWEGRKWVKVDSVVDSGAACPVAPPTMTPNVPSYQESSPKGIWAPFFTPPPPPISPHFSYAYYFDFNKSWPLVSSAYYFDHRQYEGHFVYTNGTLGRDTARSFDRSF